MAEHTRKLHFKDSGDAEHTAQLYTAYGDVLPPEIQLNADGTTGGITLYTTGNDTNYPALRVKDGNDTVFGALVDPQDGRASNLRCEYQGTEYAVAEQVEDLSPVGICLVATGGGSGTWQRVDENGNAITSNVDFDKIYPWSGIHDVTVNNQQMVFIPKFYVKTGTFNSGAYKDMSYWMVSGTAREDYHIHPAFMYNGAEMSGIYIGKYHYKSTTKLSIDGNDFPDRPRNADPLTSNDALGNLTSEGWHFLTIYEFATIQRLCLIEIGDADVGRAIGVSNYTWENWGSWDRGNFRVTHGCNWRGILDLLSNGATALLGINPNDKTIIANSGGSNSVSAEITIVNGKIETMHTNKGLLYDLNDIFLPYSVGTANFNGTVMSYSYDTPNNYSVHAKGSDMFSLFYFGRKCGEVDIPRFARIAKYDI